MRPSDLFPKILIDELLRLGKLNPNWVQWTEQEEGKYNASCVEPTWLRKLWRSGADAFAMWAGSTWLASGPKCFIPTAQQCEALEQVEVNLTLADYSQPYPALLVILPKGRYGDFNSILCHKADQILTCVLHTPDHEKDIVTTIARQDSAIEESLRKFDDECKVDAPIAALALRTACNACLALSHYGNHLDYLFPKEVENDKRLAKEKDTERGERARQRIPLAVMVASLDQEVKLHRTENKAKESGSSGREVSTHWRRGHWHTVAHGTGKSLRKRVLYPPVLVRADLFTGDNKDLTTTYKA